MLYFEAKMHKIRFRLGELAARTSKGRGEGGKACSYCVFLNKSINFVLFCSCEQLLPFLRSRGWALCASIYPVI